MARSCGSARWACLCPSRLRKENGVIGNYGVERVCYDTQKRIDGLAGCANSFSNAVSGLDRVA